MIERYTSAPMKKLWSEHNEWATILKVEIAALEAMVELGEAPAWALEDVKSKADFTVERIHEIERETNHDIIAFLTNVAENVGDASKFVHKGLTSSDVKDTAICFMLKEAADILLGLLNDLREVLRRRAVEFKMTPCVGRTHGIHAEPMTFGLKLLLWSAEIERDIDRLERAQKIIAVGKLSGAVGTYSNIDPRVEELVCQKLGLQRAPLATQVIQRDRHAEYLSALAIASSTLEKMATELRNLQRTDIREAEEFFSKGQKGSSAMPHKRNPITSERICGLARLVRTNALAAIENNTLWHERDISHSSVERVILPDSTIILDYQLRLMIKLIDRLLVYPEAMLHNLNRTGGLIFSQRLLLALVDKGVLREDAYVMVQRNAMKRWLEGEDFRTNVERDEEIGKYLTRAEIEACFDVNWYLRRVDEIYQRFGL